MKSSRFSSPRPRKRFAQHWLRSEKALNEIVAAAQLQKSDRVLEIGPGLGILTRRLLAQSEAVVAVEIDRDLCRALNQSLGATENFLLLQGDFLSLDLATLVAPFPAFQNLHKVVANIPYNITAPILDKLLGTIAKPNRTYEVIVLLMQKEVADRIVAHPGTKAFGGLSVRVQYLAQCEYIGDVPAQAFSPPPKVDSAVIRLSPQPPVQAVLNPQLLDQLVKQGFATRRKMLRNNLKSLVESDRLSQLLEQLKINPQARAENLSVQDWVRLSNQLSQFNH